MMIQRCRYRKTPSIAAAPTSSAPKRIIAARVAAVLSAFTALPTISGCRSLNTDEAMTHSAPRISGVL